MSTFDYSYAELIDKYHLLGINHGDTLFVTTGLGYLGRMANIFSQLELCEAHLKALLHIVGDQGTIVVPTYSYSFNDSLDFLHNVYDPLSSPSGIGPFPNYVVKHPAFKRSLDPMMSVSVCGPHTDTLLHNLPSSSYGHDSIFERLLSIPNMKCLSVGLGTNWTPFIHYLDYITHTPYRYDKLFQGFIVDPITSDTTPLVWNYTVPIYLSRGSGNCHKLGRLSEINSIWTIVNIGKSQLCCSSYRSYFDYSLKLFQTHDWLTTLNSRQDIITSEKTRLNSLQASASTPSIDKYHLGDLPCEPNIITLTLDHWFKFLSENISSTSFDLYHISTGSNVGDYVMPEMISPIGLSISDSSGSPLFSSTDISIISRLIVPFSCSFDGSIPEYNSSPSVLSRRNTQHQSSSILQYSNIFQNEFLLWDSLFCQLSSLNYSSLSDLHFSFHSERFYHEFPFLLLMPNNLRSISDVSLVSVDLLEFNYPTAPITRAISQLLANDFCIILTPLFPYGPSAFHANVGVKPKNLYELNSDLSIQKLSIPDVYPGLITNPAINSSHASINTIDFLVT